MKKQRKNTISREAVSKQQPQEAPQKSFKKPASESGNKTSRAPRSYDSTEKSKRKNVFSAKERNASSTATASKPKKTEQDYFSNFKESKFKKKKEDFKIRKNDVDVLPPSTNPRKDEYKPNRTSTGKRTFKEKFVAPKKRFTEKELIEEKMPLNKFISRAGICSRREAADLIKNGEVLVNGVVNKEPGYKVAENDIVTYQGNDVATQEKQVYFLLNKAKDYITTTDDPEGRKTVMDLFKDVKERIFPVGRLDRNTTGLLLLTNDGHLAQKLSHPSFKNKKVYQVKLDKALTQAHFDNILQGLKLEDGIAKVDTLAYTNPENKKEVGIEIHIGKNRIVRRIFEHLGYEVKHLDRVMYAGLTKKNLPRGKWRALSDKEILFLKHFK